MTIQEFLDRVQKLSDEVEGVKKDDDTDVRYFVIMVDVDNGTYGIAGNTCPKCLGQWISYNPEIPHDAGESGEIVH